LSTYLDASFVVSLYAPDRNYVAAGTQVASAPHPLIVTDFCELEAANALHLRVFRKESTRVEAERALQIFQSDLQLDILRRAPLPQRAFARAQSLSEVYSPILGTRAPDLLHIAAAVEMGTSAFFSFDIVQRRLAEQLSLTLNPLP
jgi:predicted nucleic acid-binding protein